MDADSGSFDIALIGDDQPRATPSRLEIHHSRMAIDLCALQPRGFGIGVRRASCVDVTFVRMVEVTVM